MCDSDCSSNVCYSDLICFFFFQAEDGIRDVAVTGAQTCALPISLTREEREIVQMHPIWGIELLADVEFPWDIKPIIRWHHERYDGSGYPDRLRGEEIPLSAQIVGILSLYDSLTTTRRHQPALTAEQAIEHITACRHWWSPRVFDAFLQARPQLLGDLRGQLTFVVRQRGVGIQVGGEQQRPRVPDERGTHLFVRALWLPDVGDGRRSPVSALLQRSPQPRSPR